MTEETVFIKKVVDKITHLGLTAPAILLLEAHKPLAFMGSQLLLVAQPTLGIFLPPNLIRNTANLLADPDQLEELIVRLEMSASPLTHKTQERGIGSWQKN
jgi:hypothetical protein